MKNLNPSLNKGKTLSLLALTLVGALTVGSHQAKADALGEAGGDPVASVEIIPTGTMTPYEKCVSKAHSDYARCKRLHPTTPIACDVRRTRDLEKCEGIIEA